MNDRERYEESIASIRDQWNKAEADIKLAEQVNHKIAWASIKELRYAGRRLIEALAAIQNKETDKKIVGLLQDAEFDCLRARHDAIDVATAAIAFRMDLAAEKLGNGAVLAAFEDFPKLYRSVITVRKKIVNSRKNRSNREAIYATIEDEDFQQLVDLYNEFLSSEPLMKKFVLQDRKNRLINYFIGAGGVIVALLMWIFGSGAG